MKVTGYDLLRTAIIKQAVIDWRDTYSWDVGWRRNRRFARLRMFFNSGLYKCLCGEIPHDYILRKLEQERIENEQENTEAK